MTRYAIGVDFGGTKVLAAVVDVETGDVIGTGKKKTSAKDGPDELVNRIFSTCDAALEDAGVILPESVSVLPVRLTPRRVYLSAPPT
jgi:N-acetylglucosamine kinase-like BadF-type ATPase